MLLESLNMADDGLYPYNNSVGLFHVGPVGNMTWSKSPVLFCDGHIELLNYKAILISYEAFFHEPPAEASPAAGSGS
jgi:prepilin-type processing-associated H-X9-DG protein